MSLFDSDLFCLRQNLGATFNMKRNKELEEKISQILDDKALNGLEVCREINNVAFGQCREGKFGNVSRGSYRCAWRKNKCQPDSLEVYLTLKKLWKNGKIRSVKLRFFDKRKGKAPLKTDVFRFWFKEPRILGERLVQILKDVFNLENVSLDVILNNLNSRKKR